ncbi:MAG: mechanosensitive ion channel family protein, partial [Clostridia bacterium]|nr:mechanosensitive ion channel family protein [Clostridia bacterium]
NTTLITADNKIVVLPNSVASNNPIVNFNGSEIRRLDIITNVAKGIDIDEVRELLLKVADADEDVSKDVAAAVYMIDPNNCYVNLELRVWVPATKWWDVKFRLNESVYKALKENNLLPPNPATDINLNK